MRCSRLLLAVVAVGVFFVSLSTAAIPAGYIGKPYPPGSGPHEVPGRVNFHDYDYVSPSQGQSNNVTFIQDDQAYGAVSGGGDAGGRDGKVAGIPSDSDNAWPAFFATNKSPYDLDTFYEAGKAWPNGVRYPDPVDTSVKDRYIGASHANSMTKFTIHVPTAGKYWISSIWTSDAPPIQFHINFLNGASTVSTPTITLTGMPASYHAWYKYSDFASVTLDSGIQVMQFQNGSMHLNQDFLYIAADSGQFITGVEQRPMPSARAPVFGLSISRETVRFTLPDAGKTKISLFDCLGREMFTFLDRSTAPGSHAVPLNAAGMKNGIYFVRMTHGNSSSVVKFELTR
ncbi:MAG TPA: T9SS type A sorting domain-containing protein [Chitinivibrionales bacterium]|nr:T9SS type A sorting domain-containing protein [Chitinivibrionales bacterium]